MVRMYAKLHKSMEILEYFTMRSWEWTHGHLDTLKSQMSTEDQKVRIYMLLVNTVKLQEYYYCDKKLACLLFNMASYNRCCQHNRF